MMLAIKKKKKEEAFSKMYNLLEVVSGFDHLRPAEATFPENSTLNWTVLG